MKILYLHNSSLNSNSANLIQVKAMCEAMSGLGNDVVLSLEENANEINANTTKQLYFIHLRKRLTRNIKINRYINYISVKKVIRDFNPDIIYLRIPILLLQAISSGKKIIIELHNNKLHQKNKLLDYFWKKYLIRVSKTDQIKAIVCISNALTDFWINEGVAKNKIITAHDSINHKHYAKVFDKNIARDLLKLPQEKKIVTYAGRLYTDRKIESILELAKRNTNVLFLIVGGPNFRKKELEWQASKQNLNNIHFTGQVAHEKVSLYLFASDILLAIWSSDVPTINFCSPLKVFEYMAAGRVIVAHGFPTIKEVLTHNVNALLVEINSFYDLVEKTNYALHLNQAQSLLISENARKKVFREYTWQLRAIKILQSI